MPHISSNSFPSSMDKYGYRQTVSIDFCVFHRKEHSSIYRCRARSLSGREDPRNGAILLAEFSETTKDARWSEIEVEKSKIAQLTAEKFNTFSRHVIEMKRTLTSKESGTQFIEFEIPQTCQLESVSTFDRKRKKEENFILMNEFDNSEKFIFSEKPAQVSYNKSTRKSMKKSMTAFFLSAENLSGNTKVHGRKRSNSESDARVTRIAGNPSVDILNYCCQCGQWAKPTREAMSNIPHKTLHAFVHYFFCQSNGTMAIDCLEGECNEQDGYRLTVPVIHSKDRRFGMQDRGEDGIRRVVENHVCTDLCQRLVEMKVDSTHVSQHMGCTLCCAPPHSEQCHLPHARPEEVQCQNFLYPRLPSGTVPRQEDTSQYSPNYDYSSHRNLKACPSQHSHLSYHHQQLRNNS